MIIAPIEPGDGEIRHKSGQGNRVLARAGIEMISDFADNREYRETKILRREEICTRMPLVFLRTGGSGGSALTSTWQTRLGPSPVRRAAADDGVWFDSRTNGALGPRRRSDIPRKRLR